jgi:hypothetical protein
MREIRKMEKIMEKESILLLVGLYIREIGKRIR